MTYLLASHVAMAVSMAAQMVSPTLALKRVWPTVWVALIFLNGGVWIVFALYYTGRDSWLGKPAWAFFGLTSGVPALMAITDPFHGVLATTELGSSPFRHLALEPTPLGSLFLGLAILYIVVGAAVLFRQLLVTRRSSWWQHLALVVGLLSITVTAIASASAFVPVQYFPYGVYGSAVFGVLVTVALFRTPLFAVSPLARDALFESIDDGIIVVDATGHIVDFNDAAAEILTGLESTVGDDLARAYPAFVTNDSRSEGAEMGDRSETTPPNFASSVTVETDGTTKSYRLGVSRIKSAGRIRGYALIVRDVTEIERYAADLEHKTEQLERFAAVLSHDLRNPVAVASGQLELEAMDNDSERVARALTAVGRIDDTIDDLLTLAREGEVEDRELVSIRAVAEDAWATSETGAASLQLSVDEDYRISADRSRLQTVFENLFRNAVDHAGGTERADPDERTSADSTEDGPAGEASPVVTVGPLEDGFFVADDGPGIPESRRHDVFEYGYSTSDEGTGFGLSIVQSIVDAHGWDVSVTAAESGGAQFEIRSVEQR